MVKFAIIFKKFKGKGNLNEQIFKFKEFICFWYVVISIWLWGRSKDKRVLFSTYRRSQSKSSRMQKVGEYE